MFAIDPLQLILHHNLKERFVWWLINQCIKSHIIVCLVFNQCFLNHAHCKTLFLYPSPKKVNGRLAVLNGRSFFLIMATGGIKWGTLNNKEPVWLFMSSSPRPVNNVTHWQATTEENLLFVSNHYPSIG